MFKRLVIISALIVLAVTGYAQSTNIGFSMGANFTNLVGRNRIADSDPRIGVCPGFHVEFPLAYLSYLEVSAIYSQQGVRIYSDEFPVKNYIREKTTITRYVDYVNIPVLWKQEFGDLYAKIGPYASLAMKAVSKKVSQTTYGRDSIVDYDSSTDTTEIGRTYNQSFINSLRQFDVGASMNVGFRTSLGRSNFDFFIEASYKIGFFSVEENPRTKADALRNHIFSVTAGFFIVNNRRSTTYRRR